MAATYNPVLASNLDKVRFKIGDIDVTKALVPDETIGALLSVSGASVLSVSADLASNIAARFAQKVDTDLDGQGLKYSQLSKQFYDLYLRLQAAADAEKAGAVTDDDAAARVALGGGILAMGTSTSERIAARNDPENLDNFHPWLTECHGDG